MPHPSRLYFTPAELADFARFFAAEVGEGKYPYVDYDLEDRWHQRLYRDRRVDVWLISWLPTQGTQLHDHGGSAGAFTVVSGTLAEAIWNGTALDDHERTTGETVTFGEHRVHDVRNLSREAAVSVHAYSAPLTSMGFYDVEDGRLTPLGTLWTDDPEPDPATVRLRVVR